MKTDNLSIAERSEIIRLHRLERNISQISRSLNISRNTVRFWIKRESNEGTLQTHKRCGRRPKIGNMEKEAIRHAYEDKGVTQTNYLAEEFNVSTETIRRHLHNMGFNFKHSIRKVNKPTDPQKTSRLNFANGFIDFDWSTTIFSDQKTFQLSQDGRLTMCNDVNAMEGYDIFDKEFSDIFVNIWGWISADGVGELSMLPKSTALNYVEHLETVMVPSVRNVYPDNELPKFNYVQSNCRLYGSSVCQDWFQRHPFIQLIQWPSRSPDLNPFEYIWEVMVQRWNNQIAHSQDKIFGHCSDVWEAMRGTDLCSQLVGLMTNRLQVVIQANGGYI